MPEIEAWVLALVDRVEAKQPIEDARVELKAAWLEPAKAARQLAGHANAARGEPILWVIGLDEKRGATGAEAIEAASWWGQTRRCFDGLAPEVDLVNVPVAGKTLVALLIDTGRAPYVVKNPDGGAIQYEVPWREGTATRTARREDLLRILVPYVRAPTVELLDGTLTLKRKPGDHASISVSLHLYLVPVGPDRVVIPFHRCQVSILAADGTHLMDVPEFRLHAESSLQFGSGGIRRETLSLTVEHTLTELVADGPGAVRLWASGTGPWAAITDHERITLRVRLGYSDPETRATVFDVAVVRTAQGPGPTQWTMAPAAG